MALVDWRGDRDKSVASRPSPLTRAAVYKAIYLSARTLSHLRMTGFPFHVIRLSEGQRCDLENDDFQRKATDRRPVLVSGWNFNAGSLFQKHADRIRSFYRMAQIINHASTKR